MKKMQPVYSYDTNESYMDWFLHGQGNPLGNN